MVTEITGVGLSSSLVAQTGTTVTSRVAEASLPVSLGAKVAEAGNGLVSSASQVTGAYGQLRTRQEALNQAASVVRAVDDTVEKADELLSGMESELGAVVKMYPPYPIDNPERISMLNSFAGLRRQIDALTFPPPATLEAVGRVLSSRDEAESSDPAESKNLSVAALVKEPMWDIPTLDPSTASDDEVDQALEQVKAMKSVLEELDAGMWKDVVSFVKQAETPVSESDGATVRDQLSSLGDDKGGIGRNAAQLEAAAESH